jgi:hypothetical protein
MARDKQTKAERRQAAGAQGTKAERKQARAGRKQRAGSAADAPEAMAGVDASTGEDIDLRLARIEEAVATQSELSEQLLGKLDEVLHEARKSARLAKTAVTQAEGEDDQEPPGGP